METQVAPALDKLYQKSHKRSLDLFLGNYEAKTPDNVSATKLKLSAKVEGEYAIVSAPQRSSGKELAVVGHSSVPSRVPTSLPTPPPPPLSEDNTLQAFLPPPPPSQPRSQGLIPYRPQGGEAPSETRAMTLRNPYAVDPPSWHPPWKLTRVIAGHLGWVRAIAMDPANEWFVTGAGDRTIKVWDLASGALKLTLTGHISCVRGLAVSARHPYLFSCGEDKQVKCWDLECNKVIRHYHGHLSGVYCMSLHPALDVLITGGRDSTARVWDIRTKAAVHVLVGHNNTVASVASQAVEPQVITGSHDSTVRLWDLAKGQSVTTLTHHKKSVRALAHHPTEYSMASASPDNIKQWKFPEGRFLKNFSGHNAIIHTLAVNRDNVLFSGADNGSMSFWDWRTGYCFQRMQTTVQPGSLESEAGVMCSTFDLSGSRLICGEADKSIKIYKEDDSATPETHPIDSSWRKDLKKW